VASTPVFNGVVLSFLVAIQASDAIGKTSDRVAGISAKGTGPLRVSSANTRYFEDGTGRIVYLTGSHTWSNFKEFGNSDPPRTFNYSEYLDFLGRYHHNFVRLWTLEAFKALYNGKARYATVWPWPRIGSGSALDGKPRFDLSQFSPEYFDRLRSRVVSAGERGIYVAIMLFNGYAVQTSDAPWRWDGHPFNERNNVNGIGRGLTSENAHLIHTLSFPAITAIQEAYVKKVVDTVSDLDNVLYEIANESGSYSTEWQYHLIRLIKSYEASKAKQHPVGMTFQFGPVHRGTNETLFESPADWISPGPDNGYKEDPPAADGAKVIISDTDHLWGVGGDWTWVWKSFTRGLNPIYMDSYGEPDFPPHDESARKAMGDTLMYAKKMDLRKVTPHGELVSTGYALANPGSEYLIYAPAERRTMLPWLDKSGLSTGLHWLRTKLGLADSITVDLTGFSGIFHVEWFNPRTGDTVRGETTTGGARQTMVSPFFGDVVLYLSR
jgi:hypothetical protein